MKFRRFFYLIAAVLCAATTFAEEKSSPSRKTMIFQPGAKTPDGVTPVAPPARVEKPAVDASAADAPAQFAANFFGLLQKGELDRAYENLTRGSKIAERPEELKTLKAKTKEALDVFGPLQGFEMVESKSMGERLLRRTYLSLGKEFPLRWRFYFYKPDLAWRLIDLRVDDRLVGIFDEHDEAHSAENQ
jgi:hypothetical protein